MNHPTTQPPNHLLSSCWRIGLRADRIGASLRRCPGHRVWAWTSPLALPMARRSLPMNAPPVIATAQPAATTPPSPETGSPATNDLAAQQKAVLLHQLA